MLKNITIILLCLIVALCLIHRENVTNEPETISGYDRIGEIIAADEYVQAQQSIAHENYVMALKHFIRVIEIAPTWRDGLNGMGMICHLLDEKEMSQFFYLLYSNAEPPDAVQLKQISSCLDYLRGKYFGKI